MGTGGGRVDRIGLNPREKFSCERSLILITSMNPTAGSCAAHDFAMISHRDDAMSRVGHLENIIIEVDGGAEYVHFLTNS